MKRSTRCFSEFSQYFPYFCLFIQANPSLFWGFAKFVTKITFPHFSFFIPCKKIQWRSLFRSYFCAVGCFSRGNWVYQVPTKHFAQILSKASGFIFRTKINSFSIHFSWAYHPKVLSQYLVSFSMFIPCFIFLNSKRDCEINSGIQNYFLIQVTEKIFANDLGGSP